MANSSNFKYENGDIAYTIESFFKKLYDLKDSESHADGKDIKFETIIDIKSCKFKVKNFIHAQNKKYNSNGSFVFYRSNHKELIEKNGKYILIVYSLNHQIKIHACKTLYASQIDHLIKKSLSKEKIGISWSSFFNEISENPLFEIPREVLD